MVCVVGASGKVGTYMVQRATYEVGKRLKRPWTHHTSSNP